MVLHQYRRDRRRRPGPIRVGGERRGARAPAGGGGGGGPARQRGGGVHLLQLDGGLLVGDEHQEGAATDKQWYGTIRNIRNVQVLFCGISC